MAAALPDHPNPVPEANPATAPSILRLERLDPPHALVRREPFPHATATQLLDPTRRDALLADFPRYTGAGFFPYDASDCGPAINALVAELTSPAVADALGAHLGIDALGRFPSLVTICRALNPRHGNIHTDSASKIATALVYLEPEWTHGGAGSLRFLAGPDDIDALVAPELAPVFGNFAVFRRTACSFHGHLPFTGERRVIQVAWLTSDAEKQRKTRRGRFSRFVKWLAGSLDRRWGKRD